MIKSQTPRAFQIRISKIKKMLTVHSLDAVLISSVANITYVTNYSGFSAIEREAYLLISQEKNYIITDTRYSESVSLHIPHFQLLEISSQNSLKSILKNISQEKNLKRIGIEPDDITLTEYKLLKTCFNDLNHLMLENIRSEKDAMELSAIKKACALGDNAFTYAIKKLRIGVTEKELALKLELFVKKHGAALSFPSIVAFGNHSSIPHHHITDRKLQKNSIVLLDFGVKLNNYCSDMTRTIFFGSATAEFKKIYHTVLTAQQKSIDYLASTSHSLPSTAKGIQASKLDQIARRYIISQNFHSIPHSLGHGIGIQVHEAPRLAPKSKDILKPGMVFSVEPGIYIPGFGGVRIEDLVALEKNGVRVLTQAQKELVQLPS